MKYLLIFILLTALPLSAMAQPGRYRLQEFKVAFITEHLALSSQDSARFWPVYNAYENEKLRNRKAQNDIMSGFIAKNDTQLKQDMESVFKLREEEMAIEKKYFAKFQEVISIRQIAALYQAENQLKKRLLERFGGGGPGRGN